MGDAGRGVESNMAEEASGRTSTAACRSLGSTRSRALRWAIAGAVWGALSFVARAGLPDLYFELFGYRLGRVLQWLIPVWWAARIDEASGILWLGKHPVVLAAAGVALGAAAAIALWWAVERMRTAVATDRE